MTELSYGAPAANGQKTMLAGGRRVAWVPAPPEGTTGIDTSPMRSRRDLF